MSVFKIECSGEKAVEAVESACGAENCVIEGLAVLTDVELNNFEVEYLLGLGYVSKTTELNEFDVTMWARYQ